MDAVSPPDACLPFLILEVPSNVPDFDETDHVRACYRNAAAAYAAACASHSVEPKERFREDLLACAAIGLPLSKVMLSHLAMGDAGLQAAGAALDELADVSHDTEVVLSYNAPSPRCLAALLASPCLRSVCVLELFACGVADDACTAVGDMLADSPPLRRLKLGDNAISARGAFRVARGLATNVNLAQLHLGGNPLGDAGVAHVCHALVGNTSLTSLSLRSVGFGSEGWRTLAAEAARPASCLAELSLRGNPVRCAADTAALGAALASRGGGGALRLLELQGTGLNEASLRAFAAGAAASTSLRELNVGCNPAVGAAGLAALCRQLRRGGSPLRALLADDVGATAACGSELARYLAAPSCRLRTLHLRDRLGDRAVQPIAEALRGHPTLRTLALAQCGVGPAGSMALADAVGSGTVALTSLDFSGNVSGASGGVAWAAALGRNATLTRLSLTDNEMPAAAVRLVQSALDRNTTLRQFTFGGQSTETPTCNAVPATCRAAIARTLVRNREACKEGPATPEVQRPDTVITSAVMRCLNAWLRSSNIDAKSSLKELKPSRQPLRNVTNRRRG